MTERPPIQADLIARCQRGDAYAFDSLYDLFGQMVWRLCARMAGSTTDAEDMAQETWIQVWRKIETYRCESSFPTWLYKVATNVCLQRLRRSRPQPMCSIEEVDRLASACGDPAGRLETELIIREIERLPDSLRLPLMLRVNEELSYAEIADILECTTAAVKMRIARARIALVRALEVEAR